MSKLRALILGFLLMISGAAYAAEVQIDMLNKLGKERMVYSKKFVKINVGDTIKWKAADKTHNVVFIKNAIPKGVEIFKSKMNKDAEYTFNVPGIYAYKCQPHFGMGMIGFVQVGDDTHNLEAVKNAKYIGKSKKIAADILKDI